ncbi:MAG: hypothetical protein IPN17_13965 [Deltaproteobacteria bacterium]|nr:hypothetical protein [Deltaproteobacteria bacterium]MBK8693358.1 hypothetical protein [Deltaproteobacteria bacterium]MBP6832928.1 hypothetical protein [Deltaproteobacteria bacterium]
MRKDSTPRDMLLDRRVVERNIRTGIVTREEYDTFLRELGDTADNAESVTARLGEDDLVDDIDDDEEETDDVEG